ncbi:MAG: energy transducer TonB [Gammaproteobacteria bacterium]
MKRLTTLALLLLVAAASAAAEPAPETPTWQAANKRSAALIRLKGPSAEAADFARTAFDLYPLQVRRYSGEMHAQLLLNLLDTRHKAEGRDVALREFDEKIEALQGRAGADAPVLVDLWREGATIAGRGSDAAGRYSERALAVADQVFGPGDPRTLTCLLHAVRHLRVTRGYDWALGKLLNTRGRAERSADRAQVDLIDLLVARLDLDSGSANRAINGYRALIGRLERLEKPGADQNALLRIAYAQLLHVYQQRGDVEAARALQRRQAERGPVQDEPLVPLLRVEPRSPPAARDGFVEMELLIGADGAVHEIVVIRAEPQGAFEESAIEAIRQWRFKPGVIEGKPVVTAGRQRIDFDAGTRRPQ